MARVNVLVLLHGMTLEANPGDHTASYNALWERLRKKQPALGQAIKSRIQIEWGHERAVPPPGGRTPDENITRAENTIRRRSNYTEVKADNSPYNHLLPGAGEFLSQLVLRRLTTPTKERILMLGFTDALYYCSPDGERAVRKTVYTQLLYGLDAYRDAAQVRLHVIAESLGATVAFDFLYGLFAPDSEFPDGTPGFVRERQGDRQAVQNYTFWRGRAKQGRLVLGSKSSTGAQLPLMMMRKQKLVDILAADQLLDASVIGLFPQNSPTWKIFYDVDDLLGFPARRLFKPQGSIHEYQVNTGWRPDAAHGRYWENDTVLKEIAHLIQQNL